MHGAEGRADGFYGNRIDVASDRGKTELMGFTDGGAGAHEGIEYRYVREIMRLIEFFAKVTLLGQDGAQQDTAKHRPKPFSPPFVNVIDRTVDFLSPTFTLGELGKKFEWKAVRFDQSRNVILRHHHHPFRAPSSRA